VRESSRLEEAILEVVKAGPTAHAGSDPGTAGSARVAAYFGSHHCSETGQHLVPLRECTEGSWAIAEYFQAKDSSGKRIRRAALPRPATRTSDASWWNALVLPTSARVGEKLRKRHEGIPAEIIEIAWKAQNRLHKRYMKLTMAGRIRGSPDGSRHAITGFIWAIAIKAEAMACKQQRQHDQNEKQKQELSKRKKQKTIQP